MGVVVAGENRLPEIALKSPCRWARVGSVASRGPASSRRHVQNGIPELVCAACIRAKERSAKVKPTAPRMQQKASR